MGLKKNKKEISFNYTKYFINIPTVFTKNELLKYGHNNIKIFILKFSFIALVFFS